MKCESKAPLLLRTLGLVPKNALSRAVGAAAHVPLPGPLARASIHAFARLYHIDVAESERPPRDYSSVGKFFARRLRPGARPIDRRPGIAVAPADGRLLNHGRISGDGRLIQAKDRTYRVGALLADDELGDGFLGGSWTTIYLSPRDYHRVHFPVEGRVVAARYVPGNLWPVNGPAVAHVDQLFCVNERLITYVDSPLGLVAIVMVGATSVGHITVAYDPSLETNRSVAAGHRSYSTARPVARGDELGVFHLGSTVVVVFANADVEPKALLEGEAVRVGQAIARGNGGAR